MRIKKVDFERHSFICMYATLFASPRLFLDSEYILRGWRWAGGREERGKRDRSHLFQPPLSRHLKSESILTPPASSLFEIISLGWHRRLRTGTGVIRDAPRLEKLRYLMWNASDPEICIFLEWKRYLRGFLIHFNFSELVTKEWRV